MFFRYGSYTFAVGEPGVLIERVPIKNAAQQTLAIRETWTIDAFVKASSATPASVSSKVSDIEDAFSEDGQDFGLLLPSGGSPGAESTNWVNNNDCLGGTRVIVAPSYPEGGAGEYVGFRTVRIVLEGIKPTDDSDRMLVSFRETIKRMGGGPRYGHIETKIGKPVKQEKRSSTIYRATQSGEAVGYMHRPRLPIALWPDALVEAGEIEDGGNDRIGDDYFNYVLRWTYQFESAGPLIGLPHAWVR